MDLGYLLHSALNATPKERLQQHIYVGTPESCWFLTDRVVDKLIDKLTLQVVVDPNTEEFIFLHRLHFHTFQK